MQGSLKKITGATGLLVLLALLVIINVLAGQLRLRVDTTAEKLYTLSDGTRAVLKALPRAVTLKFYRSVGAEGLPPAFQQYAQRIDDLLQEYASASGGRVSVELLDPQPDSDQEEWRNGTASSGSAWMHWTTAPRCTSASPRSPARNNRPSRSFPRRTNRNWNTS